MEPDAADIAIVGGGAAGLATAIFVARRMPGRSVVVLDGAKKLGAKILISGGGRCNVTNRVVTADDFAGGSSNVIRRVLAALPVDRTIEFFHEIGVELREEDNGKLFPVANRARAVLDALLGEAERLGVHIRTQCRVTSVRPEDEGFRIIAGETETSAAAVVLATGGRSFPKTGSDGFGYRLAEALRHSLVSPTPSLAPLVLDGTFHVPLSGIAHDVELTLQAADQKPVHVRGALLWTHFGVSGPAAMDMSRYWHRARLEKRDVEVRANFVPGEGAASIERRLVALASEQPRSQLHNALARFLPGRVADAILGDVDVPRETLMAHLSKPARRTVAMALAGWPLPIRDSRGYAHAEATAGGVPLNEVSASSLSSRKCPGLYLVGEILDVDGRIGGFNFQWAWSSAWVVASALARRARAEEDAPAT